MRTEIGEQVLADGGHYERSTLYHAAFLEDLLDTVGIMHAYGSVPDPAWCLGSMPCRTPTAVWRFLTMLRSGLRPPPCNCVPTRRA